jgi:hypothetical protein
MKRLIAGIAIMCGAAAIFSPAAAQDTIKASDVNTQFAAGNFTTTRFDSTVTAINIGKPGASSWNFTGLKKSSVATLKCIAVAGSPFTSSFPGATHVLQTDISISYAALGSTPIPVTAYIYFQLSGDLLNLGEGANGTGPTWTGSKAIITNTPADLFYKLPSTLGTTWTSTYMDTADAFPAFLPGVVIPIAGVRHHASYVVDAFGPLTLPNGTVHQVLRIKKTDSTSYKSVNYIFLAKDGTLVQVTAAGPALPDSGTIAVAPPVSWGDAVNTSAASGASVPEKFSLEQNYPNPFNPSTAIAYSVPVRSSVRLEVYNLLGQRVAVLVNGDVEAGAHSVEWHPSAASGVYLCRMSAVALDKSAASFSSVRKMAYIR